MKIESVMTKDVVTLLQEDTIRSASLKMAEKGISGAPVINGDGKLIGMLSEADVLRSLKTTKKTLQMVFPSLSSIGVSFREQLTEKEALEAYQDVENMTVKELMTLDVVTVSSDDELRDAISQMVAKGINRLPVVDKMGKVVGIITRGDILRGIAQGSMNNL